MGSDFYKRSRELFEEFQKRELHYLNTESIYSDRFHITSDSSLPVQEYLQKLNKREKESEDTYRGLMAHMEELDRRTESISAKLEKLNSLRTSMSLRFSTYPSSTNLFDQQYPNYSQGSSLLQANQDFKYLSALKTTQDITFPSAPQITQIKETKFAATQTDLMFCENCQFPITFSSRISNISLPLAPESSFSLLQNESLNSSTKKDSSQILNLSIDSSHQNTNLETSQTISQPSEGVHQRILSDNNEDDLKLIPPVAEIPVLSTKENEIDTHVSDKNDRKAASEKVKAESDALSKTIIVTNDDNDLVNEKNPSIEDAISISDRADKAISKSDDESLNHEFDFLDSDKRSQRRNLQTKEKPLPQASKSTINNLTTTQQSAKTDQAGSQIDKDDLLHSNKNTLKTPLYNPKNTHEAEDKQSESSISIGGAHSPSLRSENLSAVSDSDSLYEKEDPHIKTSAAYQALLGNIPIAKSVQQLPYSESESEDEIEKALANTTKKNRKISNTSASQEDKTQDSKKSVPESKPKMEPRKSISGGKSQQLSKNTRKVLGLDTSSGSEGEIKLEANVQKKIEEDSDEFDFYD